MPSIPLVASATNSKTYAYLYLPSFEMRLHRRPAKGKLQAPSSHSHIERTNSQCSNSFLCGFPRVMSQEKALHLPRAAERQGEPCILLPAPSRSSLSISCLFTSITDRETRVANTQPPAGSGVRWVGEHRRGGVLSPRGGGQASRGHPVNHHHQSSGELGVTCECPHTG